jgi:hypothetical protein
MKHVSESPEAHMCNTDVDSINLIFGKYQSSISDSERIRRANRRFEQTLARDLASRVVSESAQNPI